MNTDKIDTVEDVPLVNRVEVIDETGRAYVNTHVEHVQYSLQDGGHTLKLFVTGREKSEWVGLTDEDLSRFDDAGIFYAKAAEDLLRKKNT